MTDPRTHEGMAFDPTAEPAPGPAATFEVPLGEIIEWRRHLHQNPELSFQEYATADFIEGLLEDWGIDTVRLTPTSVVGTITGTAGDPATGRTIGYRADIDALPIKEETGLPFASHNAGVMHACGHDVHTAMLLGTARILQDMRDRLHGRVKLLFQHAEEMLPGGARELVALGAADDLDEVYAFHVAPHPIGHVGICRGRVSTMSGIVSISIRGRGGHSSNPQLSVDPVMVASEVTVMLNTIVSRNLDPKHMNIVNVGSLHAGEAGNVIPDTAWLEVSIRSIDEEDWASICGRIETLVTGICHGHGATATFEWQTPYPMVVNADVASDRAWHAATRAIGPNRVFEAEPWAPSDDFSYFSREVPGCYMFLGGGGPENGMPYFLHNSRYDVAERAMSAGVKVEVQIALDALAPGLPLPPSRPQQETVMPAAGAVPPRPATSGLRVPESKAGEQRDRREFHGAGTGPAPAPVGDAGGPREPHISEEARGQAREASLDGKE
ncbi:MULTISPECIES: M20 family metallopeptidase [Corynebacterium]|uniref:M20 metallopeptidase family protein n=1 Tax=Corynebacterium TaxID=1716 RepID=UPI000AB245C4|nr:MULTISPECIES: amidohydrolase [Corynebacterium]MCG7439258.1 amidohydrolase [Corynebacterium freneyi]UBI03039.1 amidohydrolase [Corynebacterium freneyi]